MKKIIVYCDEISCKYHSKNSKVFCDAERIHINLMKSDFVLHGDVLTKPIRLKSAIPHPICCSYWKIE